MQCVLPDGIEHKNAGRYNKLFPLEKNILNYESVRLDLNETRGALTFYKSGAHDADAIHFGFGEHIPGDTPFQKYISDRQYWGKYTFPHDTNPRRRSRCGSAGVWTDEKTLVIRSHLLDTVQSFTVTCHFGGEALAVQIAPFGVFAYDALPCVLTHINSRREY